MQEAVAPACSQAISASRLADTQPRCSPTGSSVQPLRFGLRRRHRPAYRLRLWQLVAALLLGIATSPLTDAAVTELSWSSSSATAVATDATDGAIFVCGQQPPSSSLDPRAPLVAKYSASGTLLWQQTNWTSDTSGVEPVSGVCSALAVSSGVFVAININSTNAVVLRLATSTGQFEWRQDLEVFQATALKVTDTAVVVGGNAIDTDGGRVARLDVLTGTVQWTQLIPDTRVYGVDVVTSQDEERTLSVFAVGDTDAGAEQSGIMALKLNAFTGTRLWTQFINSDSSDGPQTRCRLDTSKSTALSTAIRGTCDVAAVGDAVFVTGTAVGGTVALSTFVAERRAFERLCSSAKCENAVLARVDASSGNVAWVRQLVSAAKSTGERVAVVNGGAGVVLLASAAAGVFPRQTDVMEQLAVLRVTGDGSDSRWAIGLGGSGPDWPLGLAVSSAPSSVLVLGASTLSRGASDVVTVLRRLSPDSGVQTPFCRDAFAFGSPSAVVARPDSGSTPSVALLPVHRVLDDTGAGSVCSTAALSGSNTVSVDYETIEGAVQTQTSTGTEETVAMAVAGIDFVSARGAVRFAAGETIAHVAVQVLPSASSSTTVAFTVRLLPSSGTEATTTLVTPVEVRVELTPASPLAHAASSGAFWRTLTSATTLAALGLLVLVFVVRAAAGNSAFAWMARQRAAFEYRALHLGRRFQSTDTTGATPVLGSRRKSRRWPWTRRRASIKRQDEDAALVNSAGPDVERTSLSAHLAAIQQLNATLEQALAEEEQLPRARVYQDGNAGAVVTPILIPERDQQQLAGGSPQHSPLGKRRSGLLRLVRSPSGKRRGRRRE